MRILGDTISLCGVNVSPLTCVAPTCPATTAAPRAAVSIPRVGLSGRPVEAQSRSITAGSSGAPRGVARAAQTRATSRRSGATEGEVEGGRERVVEEELEESGLESGLVEVLDVVVEVEAAAVPRCSMSVSSCKVGWIRRPAAQHWRSEEKTRWEGDGWTGNGWTGSGWVSRGWACVWMSRHDEGGTRRDEARRDWDGPQWTVDRGGVDAYVPAERH